VQELLKRDELEYDDIHAIFAEYGKARNQVPIQTVHPDDPKPDETKYMPPPPEGGVPPSVS
jgi:hypothetical protein